MIFFWGGKRARGRECGKRAVGSLSVTSRAIALRPCLAGWQQSIDTRDFVFTTLVYAEEITYDTDEVVAILPSLLMVDGSRLIWLG